MMSEASFDDRWMGDVLARVGVDSDSLRSLVGELWSARADERPPSELELPTAAALGAAALESGEDIGEVVRRILVAGRALVELAQADDPDGVERLRRVVDEAAVRASGSFWRTSRERREAWLSYMCHDLKNPLNTILNALWLIREHGAGGKSDRFLELAERAVRRLEGGIKDVRDLQQKERTPPRGRGGEGLVAGAGSETPPPRRDH